MNKAFERCFVVSIVYTLRSVPYKIKASGKPATEWFGKYTHDILMHPDNWWEALAVCEYAIVKKMRNK